MKSLGGWELMLSENAIKILEKRYFMKDENGNCIEDAEGMFRRVARAVAQADKDYLTIEELEALEEDFYNMMANLEFLPNSPTLMNAGRPLGQLSACFVLPIEDDMGGIFDAIKHTAIIHKSGGGTGFSFSRLRPKGATVGSTGGVSSGPVSFMKVFNAATEAVKQGGTRRGANMGMLRVDHPDILEFITCKNDNNELNNFNISIGITNKFMGALRTNDNYELIDPTSKKIIGLLSAKMVFDLIVEQAWKNGEPGIIFLDEVNKFNPIPDTEIEATNPCIVGSTKVQTVEGEIAIKDLVGKEIDVYCMDIEGKLAIRKAKSIRKTRENAKLVTLWTTKGILTCTPDHKIFTRNRGYVEAQELTTKDKIVGLNRKMQGEKYCAVALTGDSKYIKEHRFIMSQYEDIADKDVHHKNEDSLDNRKSNLEVLSPSFHSAISNIGHVDWNERNEKGQFLSKEFKRKKEQLSINGKPGLNLRILKVFSEDYTEDVYDLEVEEYHNFIANGIIIHNCGEQPLLPFEACNLGSINLALMVDENGKMDYYRLEKVIRKAVHFLDNVIDVNVYPTMAIADTTRYTRKIGLGVMGWADLLIKLGIRYDSDEAVKLAENVMGFINKIALRVSVKIAEMKGECPALQYIPFCDRVRNATVTTIAPTGTLSIISGVSSGIEPLFALEFERNQADMQMRQESKYIGVPKDLLVTAHDISYEWHVKMQAAFQMYTQNAVSKTINLPHTATKDDVRNAYLLAYKLNCKGVTVYRDGSRDGQTLSIGTDTPKNNAGLRKRPDVISGFTEKTDIGCGEIFTTVNSDGHGPFEVFTTTGKGGGCPSQSEAAARLTSLALREGVEPSKIVKQLKGIRCMSCKGKKVLSCPDAIGKALEKASSQELISIGMQCSSNTAAKCKSCGFEIEHEGGCSICRNCGESKCG